MMTKEEIANKIGRKIRQLRNSRQMTMEQLALESGMDYSQLSRIERGKINTSVYQIYVIAKALRINPEDVFGNIIQETKID